MCFHVLYKYLQICILEDDTLLSASQLQVRRKLNKVYVLNISDDTCTKLLITTKLIHRLYWS